MWPLTRREYKIKVIGYGVHVEWLEPVEQWSPECCKRYREELSRSVRGTVDQATWELLSREGLPDDPDYVEYVERTKQLLIEEFTLKEKSDDVSIGLYHGGQFVIGFRAAEGVDYPSYYRGIQLKPYRDAGPLHPTHRSASPGGGHV